MEHFIVMCLFNNPYLLDEAGIERKAFCSAFYFQILKLSGIINHVYVIKLLAYYFDLM